MMAGGRLDGEINRKENLQGIKESFVSCQLGADTTEWKLVGSEEGKKGRWGDSRA